MIKHDYLFSEEPTKYLLYIKKLYSKHYSAAQRKYKFSYLGLEIGYGIYLKEEEKFGKKFRHIKSNNGEEISIDTGIIYTRFFKRKPTLKTMETLRIHLKHVQDDPVYISI